MREIIFRIIWYSIEMLIAYMYSNSLFNKKHKTPIILLSSELFYLAIAVLNILLSNLFINLISFFIINLIILIINYEVTFRQSIVHSIVLTVVMFISECIVIFLLPSILNIDFSTYQNNFMIMLIESSLSKILYTVFCFILTKNKKFQSGKHSKAPLYLFIFPICSTIMLVLLISISTLYDLPPSISITVSVLCVILLSATVLTYILHDNYSKKETELFELRNELSKAETNKSYYQILERQNEEMHSFSHNIKNRFQMIKSLTNEKDVENYIDECYGKLEKYSMLGKTNNKILDIILNKYSVLCEIKHINFFTSVKTANLSYIKNDELSTLLSCIFDNCIEAAEKTDNPHIEFNLNNQHFFDVLTCVNSCNYNPDFKKKQLKSTKLNSEFHGYGTKIIKKIAERNHAEYSWSYDKNNGEFVTTIIFEKPTELK